MKMSRSGGPTPCASRPRGARASVRKARKPWQEASISRTVMGKEPRQLRLPFALWTHDSVAELIRQR